MILYAYSVQSKPVGAMDKIHGVHEVLLREAKYAKNQFQQNRCSVCESHVMRKETTSTKTLGKSGNSDVV